LQSAAKRGLVFDENNPNNILIDSKQGLINGIDFNLYPGQSTTASVYKIIHALTHNSQRGLYTSRLPLPTDCTGKADLLPIDSFGKPNALQAEYRAIVEKSFAAAKKVGLDPDVPGRMLLAAFHDAGISRSQSTAMMNDLYGTNDFEWRLREDEPKRPGW
jgi:hypothetical protein